MRKSPELTKFISLLLTLTLCLSLCACGAQKKPGADNAASSDDSNLSNTLVYAGESESTINPLLNNHDELPSIIFSGLMKYNANGKPVVDLAESYDYDDAALKYTFHLRNNVKWHDGKPFTSADVAYTYKELTQDKTLSADITSNYEDISDVSTPDDYTVVFTMSKYDAAMLDYFTMGILPKHLLEGQDVTTTSFNQHPVGTGRYKFVNWDTSGNMVTLTRNTDYYDKIPNIERIIYKTVSVESTKATMLQSGEADLAWLNSKYAATFNDNSKYTHWDFKTADYRAMAMDMSTDFWKQNADSIGVLNYAIDKQAVVDSVLKGQGSTAYSPIQNNPLGTDKSADIYPYDLNKFASEMESLGWKKGSDGIYERNGTKFHFTIQTREYEEERVDIANLVSNMLKNAGVDMEVCLVTKFDWKAGYNGFLAGYATQFDPDMIYAQFVTNASANTMHYSNPDVDKLLTEGRHTKDVGERQKIYSEFENVYAKDPGVVLVAYLVGNYVGISGIQGLDTTRVLGHHSVGVMWNIEDWTIKR